jgi:hypothetical protein
VRGELIAAVAIAGALATPAAAAPCQVDFIRVPDAVRPVIEDWVRAEARCAVTLAVRVIPTDDGLYVIATDPTGRIRERLVPDATTAGVLIASWVADDGSAVAPPPVTPPPVKPTWAMKNPPVKPTWAMKNPPVTPAWAAPGVVEMPPGAVAPVDVGATTRKPPRPLERLVTVGLTLHAEGGGLRGDIDVIRKWRLKLGVMAAWSHTSNPAHYDDLALDDIVLAAQAANELRRGRFGVRAALAAGIAITTGTRMGDSSGNDGSMLTPVADATVTGGIGVTARLELRAGIAVTLIPQRINNGEFFWDRDLVPQVVVGLGYRGD